LALDRDRLYGGEHDHRDPDVIADLDHMELFLGTSSGG
jgi:hypothetical protein